MKGFQSATGGASRVRRDQVVNDFRAEFSSDWRLGMPPRIADYLQSIPDDEKPVLFCDLLAVELAFRQSRGEELDSEDYSTRFPEFSGEVDKVFRAREIATSFDSRAGGDSSTESCCPIVEAAPEEICAGRMVGRYRLDAWVGRGGFGEVWKGYDPELNRPVAIKLARRDRHFPTELMEQLREEARRQGKLSHPGIVTVYDVARDDDGLHIVSEYIDGQTLRFRMKAGAIPLDDVVSLVIQVAHALHHAHTRDLVHRDVKPGNILLRSNGEPVVTDFGLAISEQEQLAEPSRTVGTWPYMSPEQARGESNQVDARTDLYSLGVVLYELLTGRYPYPAETRREYTEQILNRPARPPRTIDDSIPEELEQICLRCLAKSVDDRFTTCRDLAAALCRWRDRDAVPPSTVEETNVGLGIPRKLVWLGVATAVLVALVAVALMVFPLSHPGHEAVGRLPTLTWTPLLEQEPTMLSWEPGGVREPPRFDPNVQRYAVRSDDVRWIAECQEIESCPFQLRAVIAVDDWVGWGGIVWGLQPDEEAFPDKGYRCFTLEYYRTRPTEPAHLAVMELKLAMCSYNDIRVTSIRPVARQEIVPPAGAEAVLELDVYPSHLRVRFDKRVEWEPIDLLDQTDWLPDGRTTVGVTGRGRDTTIRDFSIRCLPFEKELSP